MNRFLLLPIVLLFACTSDSENNADSDPIPNPPQTFTIAVASSDGGNVSPLSGTFEDGQEVILEGTPNEFYQFKDVLLAGLIMAECFVCQFTAHLLIMEIK